MEFSIVTPQMGLPLPGACRVCGAVDRERYLDTGYQEEYYGAVLYCNECINHFATMFGYITEDNAHQLRSKVEEYFLQNVELSNRVKLLTGAIDGMVRSGYPSDSVDFIELDLVSLSSLTTPRSQRTESESGEGDREINESSDDKGMDLLPANVSQQQPFDLFGQ
jgi:hypothetical protein